MTRVARLTVFAVLVAAAAAGGAAALSADKEKLERYQGPPAHSSKKHVAFAISLPEGWTASGGGDRTRFVPPWAEGPHLSQFWVEVDAIAKDETGPEALLNEKDGVELWLGATRPRFEIEDRRRVKVGPRGEGREALMVKDPARKWIPDRREYMVLVPAGDVNFLLRLSAPLTEFNAREPLFRAILETFEPIGGG